LKPLFFSEKSQPCLIKDYDVIGFDVDNGLVKYDEHKLTELICRGHFNELMAGFDGAYPEEVSWLTVSRHIGVCLNNAVWDIDTGAILMLGEGRKIMHAVLGLEIMTEV
jgi:hypothetical protein